MCTHEHQNNHHAHAHPCKSVTCTIHSINILVNDNIYNAFNQHFLFINYLHLSMAIFWTFWSFFLTRNIISVFTVVFMYCLSAIFWAREDNKYFAENHVREVQSCKQSKAVSFLPNFVLSFLWNHWALPRFGASTRQSCKAISKQHNTLYFGLSQGPSSLCPHQIGDSVRTEIQLFPRQAPVLYFPGSQKRWFLFCGFLFDSGWSDKR